MKLGRYRHFKGKEYRVLGIAVHSETLEKLVVYEALYKSDVSQLWVRPKEMWNGYVEVGGEKMKRFEWVGEK